MNARKGSNGAAEPASGNGTAPPPPDEFDPADYKYALASAGPGVRRQLSIPEGRPKQYFKLDTRPDYRMDAAVYEHREGFDPETYLVAPPQQLLLGERRVKRASIRVVIVRPLILRLWALAYPTEDGRSNTWRETAWMVAEAAESEWVKFEMNESGTGWDTMVAATQWPDPVWPEEPLPELIKKAFKGRFINSDDHVILQKLRGEI